MKNVILLADYKKGKNIKALSSYQENIKKYLYDANTSLLGLEKLLYFIENEAGPDVLKKMWKSFSPEEKAEIREIYDCINRKSENTNSIIIPRSPYKKPP